MPFSIALGTIRTVVVRLIVPYSIIHKCIRRKFNFLIFGIFAVLCAEHFAG